ncbi:MAG: nucleoside-triphosphatase [Calditrichaceae bacterium]
MKEIYILTGPVRSGKTTKLTEWCEKQDNVDGILAPVVNGVRYLHHFVSGDQQRLETENSNEATVKIGRYNFDQKVFEWARERLSSLKLKKLHWLIIDEIGPLELREQGLESAVSMILDHRSDYHNLSVILVVREQLLQDVIGHYQLTNIKLHIIRDVDVLQDTLGR